MARTLARAHAGHTTVRRAARLSTSTIHPSATSSSVSDTEPHSEHVAIAVNGTDGGPDRYGGRGQPAGGSRQPDAELVLNMN